MGARGEGSRRDHRLKPRVFLAGATGAVGKRLLPLLVANGYPVWGTTRQAEKAELLQKAGAVPVVVDVFDAQALAREVKAAGPQIVIHQLTDLPPGLDPARMAEATARNARVRIEGTRNLVAAALAAGARRLIAQSIAWQAQGVSAEGVAALERETLHSPPLEGIVLRYGRFYGPGTGKDDAPSELPCHVDVAARAALTALESGEPGIVRVLDDEPYRRLSSGTK
jgi:nucleoside-diphosphate-sugar epimerase